jgi:ABC-type molybdate transport system substrate-binding protein
MANPEASQKFLAYLKTDVAQKIFLQHGFRK